MKKIVALALALVLVFSMGVPSFAVDVTVTESDVFAPDKSAIDYYTQTSYSNLNILEAIRILLQSTARELHTFVSRLDSDFFSVFDCLNTYFYGSVEVVDGLGNGNLGDMMSTFAYLGREIQGMNYFTPYSGGEATSLDEALNKNLLYIQNQIQVISDNIALNSANSGLMSGWSLSAGSAPEGFSTSWYYRIHQNLFSLSNSITRLYGGNWADSENYGNSFFYKTYMQNYELLEYSSLSTEFLSRLAFVFADDEELAFKNTIAEDKTMILDMAINGFGSSSDGFLRTLYGFDSFFVNVDFDITDFFEILNHDDESLLWFSFSVENDLDSSVSAYSRDGSNRVVSHYYDDRKAEFDELLGGILND